MAPKRTGWLVGIALLALATAQAQGQTTATSVQLTWTAPGDDGTVGTATEYDLRYSTTAITTSNFDTSPRWTGMPVPAAAGASQTTTVTGLSPSTTYWFAMKTADDANNWSVMSNVVSRTTLTPPDASRPATIALSISGATDTTATLSWTATGDDSLTGTAASYDLRWSGAPITTTNWTSATQVTGEPAPAVAGTVQTFTVRGLSRQRAYYFAIRATDESGNTSALSNVPSVTTPDTVPPTAILNLTANFMWLSWHSARTERAARGTR